MPLLLPLLIGGGTLFGAYTISKSDGVDHALTIVGIGVAVGIIIYALKK